MKQGDAKVMAIVLEGIEKYDVESIRVIFKQHDSKDAEILKEAIWMKAGGGNADFVGNVIKLFWSVEDTYLFQDGCTFYADYQIRLTDSNEMPSVKISKLVMNASLFSLDESLGGVEE